MSLSMSSRSGPSSTRPEGLKPAAGVGCAVLVTDCGWCTCGWACLNEICEQKIWERRGDEEMTGGHGRKKKRVYLIGC